MSVEKNVANVGQWTHWTLSFFAIQALIGVPPLDLEVVQRGTPFSDLVARRVCMTLTFCLTRKF